MSERNHPTPEGRAIGLIAAHVVDEAEAKVREGMPSLPERCKSCAFRGGSFPNGCIETILDAMGCAISGEPFYCHQRFAADGTPLDLCAGWMVAIGNVPPVVERAFTPAINALAFERRVAEAHG